MKIFKTISLLFIFLLSSLSSQEFEPALRSIEDVEEYAPSLNFNEHPSSVVEGCVNVISGHYFEMHEDIATTGPNSTKISRYYSTGNKAMGDFKDFWQLNLSAEIKVKNKGKKTFAEVDDRGVVSLYERAGYDEPFKLSKKKSQIGDCQYDYPLLSRERLYH